MNAAQTLVAELTKVKAQRDDAQEQLAENKLQLAAGKRRFRIPLPLKIENADLAPSILSGNTRTRDRSGMRVSIESSPPRKARVIGHTKECQDSSRAEDDALPCDDDVKSAQLLKALAAERQKSRCASTYTCTYTHCVVQNRGAALQALLA